VIHFTTGHLSKDLVDGITDLFLIFYICIKAKFLVAVQEQQVCPFFVGLFLLFVFFSPIHGPQVAG